MDIREAYFTTNPGQVEGYTLIENSNCVGLYLQVKTYKIDGWCKRQHYDYDDLIDCLRRCIHWKQNKMTRSQVELEVEAIRFIVNFIKKDDIVNKRRIPFNVYITDNGEEGVREFKRIFYKKYGKLPNGYEILYCVDCYDNQIIYPKGVKKWLINRLGITNEMVQEVLEAFRDYVFTKLKYIPGLDGDNFGMFFNFVKDYFRQRGIGVGI